MAENIKLIQWIDNINRNAATSTFEPSVELQIALRFEDLNNKLARLDDVEGLAKALHSHDEERFLVIDAYTIFEEEHEITKEDYRGRAQAAINYIKGNDTN